MIQANAIDGTVIVFEPHAGGVYVTVAGGEDGPVIVPVSKDDLQRVFVKAWHAISEFGDELDAIPQVDRARITEAGVRYIANIL